MKPKVCSAADLSVRYSVRRSGWRRCWSGRVRRLPVTRGYRLEVRGGLSAHLPQWKAQLVVYRQGDLELNNCAFGEKGVDAVMKKLVWTLWIVLLAMVVSGELLPGTSLPMRWVSSTGISDKVLHYGAYMLLAGLPILGFGQPGGILWALAMIPLGVVLEFVQKVVPGRSFDLV